MFRAIYAAVTFVLRCMSGFPVHAGLQGGVHTETLP